MRNAVLFIILIIKQASYSQLITPEVISSNGGHSVLSSGAVSWTLGEVVSDTYANNNIITKGFHQPRYLSLTSVKDIVQQGGSVYAYPNPVITDLTLDFHNMQPGTYQIEIFDVSGKLLEDHITQIDVDSNKEKIDMNNYAEGLYLFKITNTSKSITKVFRVTKQK